MQERLPLAGGGPQRVEHTSGSPVQGGAGPASTPSSSGMRLQRKGPSQPGGGAQELPPLHGHTERERSSFGRGNHTR